MYSRLAYFISCFQSNSGILIHVKRKTNRHAYEIIVYNLSKTGQINYDSHFHLPFQEDNHKLKNANGRESKATQHVKHFTFSQLIINCLPFLVSTG